MRRFWHERDMLLKAGLLQQSHVMLPCAGRLMAVAVSLPELWRSRQPLQQVEGLDLALANRLLGASAPTQSRHADVTVLYVGICAQGMGR